MEARFTGKGCSNQMIALKSVLLAAAIALPPGAAGIWSGETNHAFIDLSATGAFFYSTMKDGRAAKLSCHLDSQIVGKWGYRVLCDNGTEGEMHFYEDGTMGFDETRFTYGDCPRGCPE